MKLETQNLEIIPLNLHQFSLLLQGVDKMEEALNLASSNETLDEDTHIAMKWLYEEALKHANSEYLWYTNWQLIVKSENKSIGSAGFIKKNRDNGVVEIGYEIYAKYRGKGFATEAIQKMCSWALHQPQIKTIIAETDRENYPSHRVLQKCGMVQYEKNAHSVFWKLCL